MSERSLPPEASILFSVPHGCRGLHAQARRELNGKLSNWERNLHSHRTPKVEYSPAVSLHRPQDTFFKSSLLMSPGMPRAPGLVQRNAAANSPNSPVGTSPGTVAKIALQGGQGLGLLLGASGSTSRSFTVQQPADMVFKSCCKCMCLNMNTQVRS